MKHEEAGRKTAAEYDNHDEDTLMKSFCGVNLVPGKVISKMNVELTEEQKIKVNRGGIF